MVTLMLPPYLYVQLTLKMKSKLCTSLLESLFQATVGTKQRFYIVAQSPQEPLTMRIFWQCVWEADVYLVVQLTEDMSYIPRNSHQRLEFGQVSEPHKLLVLFLKGSTF